MQDLVQSLRAVTEVRMRHSSQTVLFAVYCATQSCSILWLLRSEALPMANVY